MHGPADFPEQRLCQDAQPAAARMACATTSRAIQRDIAQSHCHIAQRVTTQEATVAFIGNTVSVNGQPRERAPERIAIVEHRFYCSGKTACGSVDLHVVSAPNARNAPGALARHDPTSSCKQDDGNNGTSPDSRAGGVGSNANANVGAILRQLSTCALIAVFCEIVFLLASSEQSVDTCDDSHVATSDDLCELNESPPLVIAAQGSVTQIASATALLPLSSSDDALTQPCVAATPCASSRRRRGCRGGQRRRRWRDHGLLHPSQMAGWRTADTKYSSVCPSTEDRKEHEKKVAHDDVIDFAAQQIIRYQQACVQLKQQLQLTQRELNSAREVCNSAHAHIMCLELEAASTARAQRDAQTELFNEQIRAANESAAQLQRISALEAELASLQSNMDATNAADIAAADDIAVSLAAEITTAAIQVGVAEVAAEEDFAEGSAAIDGADDTSLVDYTPEPPTDETVGARVHRMHLERQSLPQS